jgi:hypothetical protein
MTHICLQLSSLIVLVLGVLLSVIGTFYLTHLYHAFDAAGFFTAVARAAWLVATCRPRRLLTEAKVTAGLTPDPEERGKSLIGIYLIFLGFVLQGVGTVLALVDFTLGIACKAT